MYIINTNILQTPMDDGSLLLLEPNNGFYFELNGVSALIFEGIGKGKNRKDIIQNIRSIYDVDDSIIGQDYDDFIIQLLEKEIITKI